VNIGLKRRRFILFGAAAGIARPVFADATDAFPARAIRILVGFGAGGGADTLARLYAQRMSSLLNVPIIVENRPGASQLLALRPLMTAAPDGYTLALGTGSALSQGPGVRDDLPYDPLKDFTHVAMVATAPGVFFTHPAMPVQTMGALIAHLKANPGTFNYGSAGVGAANHLQLEYVQTVTGVKVEHIPYKSDQEVTREVAAGAVHMGLTIAQFAIPLAQDGRLRALAVTGAKRLGALPHVPAITETDVTELHGMDNYTFYGLLGPAGMPQAVVKRLNDAVNQVSTMPDVAARMRDALFFDPATGSPDGLRRTIQTEIAKWKAVSKSINIEGSR